MLFIFRDSTHTVAHELGKIGGTLMFGAVFQNLHYRSTQYNVLCMDRILVPAQTVSNIDMPPILPYSYNNLHRELNSLYAYKAFITVWSFH